MGYIGKLPPAKAIRAKCMNCMCGQRKEIAECPITDCALYPYRFGKLYLKKGYFSLKQEKDDQKDG